MNQIPSGGLDLFGPDSKLHAAATSYALARAVAANVNACLEVDPHTIAVSAQTRERWTVLPDGTQGPWRDTGAPVHRERLSRLAGIDAVQQFLSRYGWVSPDGGMWIRVEDARRAQEQTLQDLRRAAVRLELTD